MEKGIKLSDYEYSYALNIGEYQYVSYCSICSSEMKIADGCNYRRIFSNPGTKQFGVKEFDFPHKISDLVHVNSAISPIK